MIGDKVSASEVTTLATEVSADALSRSTSHVLRPDGFMVGKVEAPVIQAAFQALVARVASLESQVADLRAAKGSAQ